VADAFSAAQKDGRGFKLFMSFDMGSMPCASPDDAKLLRNYINTYQSHPNQLKYKGVSLVSTFAGENCRFGARNLNDGWRNALKTGMPPIHFVPSFFVDPATFGGLTMMDGSFNVSKLLSLIWPSRAYVLKYCSGTQVGRWETPALTTRPTLRMLIIWVGEHTWPPCPRGFLP
jgi:hypothetical protein